MIFWLKDNSGQIYRFIRFVYINTLVFFIFNNDHKFSVDILLPLEIS